MSNEWPLVFFTVLVCLGSGTFIGVSICEWFGKAEKTRIPGAIIALITLPLGGFSSLMHLGHPERMFGALGHPTSGIFMEALMIGLTMVSIIAYLIAIKKQVEPGTRRMILLIGAILAAILAFSVGDTYVMPSRPAWNTLTLPFAYLASAASMGFFCIFMLIAALDNEVTEKMKVIAYAVLVLQAVSIIAYLLAIGGGPFPDASRSTGRVLAGDLAPLFWGGIVLSGLLIPFFITLKEWLSAGLAPFAFVGLLGTIIGALSFRILMFDLGTGVIQMMPGTVLF